MVLGLCRGSSWSVRRILVSSLLLIIPVGYAQPGDTPPPGLLIKAETAGRISADEEADLVYLDNVAIERLQHFESSSGRTHLTFNVVVDGIRYLAIMYDGDWNETDEARLSSGEVSLLGKWGEHQGLPSLTTKWAEADGAAAESTPTEEAGAVAGELPEEHDLVLLEDAAISQVDKFVSRSLKMHVRFMLQAPGDERELSGIIYEGNWDSDMLEVLRSGTATLVGYWDEYQDAPSFVLEKLE